MFLGTAMEVSQCFGICVMSKLIDKFGRYPGCRKRMTLCSAVDIRLAGHC